MPESRWAPTNSMASKTTVSGGMPWLTKARIATGARIVPLMRVMTSWVLAPGMDYLRVIDGVLLILLPHSTQTRVECIAQSIPDQVKGCDREQDCQPWK